MKYIMKAMYSKQNVDLIIRQYNHIETYPGEEADVTKY